MLRACRFLALDQSVWIDEELTQIIHTHVHEIAEVSRERVRDEIMKGLAYPCPGKFVRALNAMGFLPYVIDILEPSRDQPGGQHHAENILEHAFATLEAMEELSPKPILRLTALLHDVGKPATHSEVNGEDHFYGHEVVGADMATIWMKQMKFSNNEVEYVSKLIRGHQFRFEEDTKEKTIRRWLRKMGPDWEDQLTLSFADRRGNYAKRDKPTVHAANRRLLERVREIKNSGVPIFKEELPISGDDLITLGLTPGPIFKEIFDNILGIIYADPSKNSREWMLAYVTRNYIKGETNDSTETQP
jgi:putative nucleotidyltransferase with HDIG domain